MNFIIHHGPKTSKRNLLFIAAFVWMFAGVILLMRGFSMAENISRSHLIKILFSLGGGALFYLILFSKISLKHITRIINIENSTPSVFSFFSMKSYILMSVMIAAGILLRTSGIIAIEYLSLFYIIMGIPLLLSAFRFWYNGIIYKGNIL